MIFMQTYTGKTLDLKHPKPEQIDIRDIAHGLSQVCRFSGQCKFFYSVAQHSVLVSRIVNLHPLAGLLHDATEAYLGDVPSPVKQLCPDYKRLESKVWGAIAGKFGLLPAMPYEVHQADLRMLATERDVVFEDRILWGAHIDDVEPYMIDIDEWLPGLAEECFLERFEELTDGN